MAAERQFVGLTALKMTLYVLTCLLSLIALICVVPVDGVYAQQDNFGFTISMPVEYVNYTIVSVNGTLWAKIDGTYPMYLFGLVPDMLPMVYPTPPQTINIHITLDGKELPYSNYTGTYPSALHHTAVGDWEMVAANISPVNQTFTLGIHYEHPLQVVNGCSLFLYDLNISPYLSPQSPNSTAYFTVRLEANITEVKAFTTETDTQWNPINYTLTNDGNVTAASIVMFSEYGKPLLGDLVVIFSGSNAVPEFSNLWVLAPASVTAGLTAYLVRNRFKQLKN